MPSLWVTGPDGTLLPLEAEGHASEKDFQEVLADNPAVLAGALAQGEGETWLLVDRELPIKAEESDTGTWKLDHLFVASDGRPVLVEVKRSSDPRARREVVAQMLDYAASFEADWNAEKLRARREQRATAATRPDLVAEMEQFLAASGHDDEDQLWSAVQTQIDGGHIRLLFVADQLSPTLVRIIEYINRQLRDAEVLGVEVVRHAGSAHDVVAYEPVVRGRSSTAAQRKAQSPRRTRDEFDQVLLAAHDQGLLDQVNALVERAETFGGFETIGSSAKDPGLYINFRTTSSGVYWPFILRPRANKLVVRITKLRAHPAFAEDSIRDDLLARVASAAGLSTVQGNPDGAPWIPLDRLCQPGVVDRLADVLEWVTATADATSRLRPTSRETVGTP